MTELTLTDAEIETGGFAVMEAEEDSDGSDSDDSDGRRRPDGPTATPTAPTGGHGRDRFRRRRRRRGLAERSPAASSRSTPRSSSRSTGSRSRSPSRAPRRVASTTCSPSRTSSGSSPRAGSATRPSGSSRRAADRGSASTRATSPGARSRSPATADADRVPTAFDDGATIVLQALHHNWLPLARFCRALEAELGHPVQANSYYTPRRSQGFAVHHDTHDVFVLQVAGEKHWRVYDPLLELPLKHQRCSSSLGEPGRPVLELTLRAGDTLYLPRGWLHDALTSDTDSLHITVGVNVAHVDRRVPRRARRVRGRRRVPRSVPEDGEPRPIWSSGSPSGSARGRARRARAQFVDSRRPILDGQLEEVRALESLDRRDAARAARTVIADLDGTTLSFEGKHVAFPEHAREELEAVFAAEGPFTRRRAAGRARRRQAASCSSGD